MSVPPTTPPQPPAEGRGEPEDAATEDLVGAEGHNVGIPRSAITVPGIIGAILVALGISVIGLIIVAAVDPSISDSDTDNESEGSLIAIQASLAIGFLVAAIGATIYANGGDVLSALRRLGVRGFSAGTAVKAALIAIGAYLVLAVVISSIFNPQQEDIAENLGADRDAAVLITVLAGILIVPVAAFSEELFFRGFLFGGFRQRIGLWPAAALSGVLFGLGHMTAGDVAVALQLTLFGVILAWTYERSGTLWVPIFLHGLNNALAFYLLVTDKI